MVNHMKLAPIINPDARKEAPKPLRVDLCKAFMAGTIIWLIASLITVVLAILHFLLWFFAVICLSGFVIGILLLIWEHFDRWDYRRLGK
ncbi:hypothetical protein [Gardnerella pickettii]|uniref:DUF2530 domain-containing protein n=3 Tax=Gardnerella TaxID=2701 RepID=S4GZJ5_9BIFI|nr:hypothetical protein [Gardnerella pickettii]EPI51498.1 hypothetical protein HMPREF1576_00323 [Gardnerella pickettii JCP7719]